MNINLSPITFGSRADTIECLERYLKNSSTSEAAQISTALSMDSIDKTLKQIASKLDIKA